MVSFEDCSSKGIALFERKAKFALCRYKRGPGIFREDYLAINGRCSDE